MGARLELVLQPELVEPDRVDLPASVADPGLDDRQPPQLPYRGADHIALDRHLLLGEEVGDATVGDGGLVAEGPVLEQVADRLQAEPGELAPDLRADPL